MVSTMRNTLIRAPTVQEKFYLFLEIFLITNYPKVIEWNGENIKSSSSQCELANILKKFSSMETCMSRYVNSLENMVIVESKHCRISHFSLEHQYCISFLKSMANRNSEWVNESVLRKAH